jgi:putative ABC transport system substrate-binding protein
MDRTSWTSTGAPPSSSTRLCTGRSPEIPVEQPVRFHLIVNLITAKALGLTIPETLLATADKVMEQRTAE